MIDILIPKLTDNHYKGHKIAVWVLGFHAFKSFLASGIHIFTADGGAQSIAFFMFLFFFLDILTPCKL